MNTTALIIPFGADGSPAGRARARIWARVWRAWVRSAGVPVLFDPGEGFPEWEGRILIVAEDPLFGTPYWGEEYPEPTSPAGLPVQDLKTHPFSVARAVNNAVRLAPPEVNKFVTIGADALPDWRVVDWAAAELEHRPWSLLFGRGGSLTEDQTAEWVDSREDISGADGWVDTPAFETPCVGPIAFTRGAFRVVRGYDERFEGWAYEDVDFWARLRQLADGPEYAATSPYPLIQFDHPTGHHDLTDGNPNVRLWARKQADTQRGGYRRNDHPAPHLFGEER